MKKLLLLVCTAMFVACPGFAKKEEGGATKTCA